MKLCNFLKQVTRHRKTEFREDKLEDKASLNLILILWHKMSSFDSYIIHRLSLFIWETRLGNRRTPDQSTEPYPLPNGEQTRHARGPVHLRTFRYINNTQLLGYK